MSQILLPGNITTFPFINKEYNNTVNSVTLNATGEACFMIGHVMLENPLGGSKTISSAGGGSIVWRSGAVTFSNGSTVFDVGIQDVSTASAPAQGDGTFDVKASFTGGGGGVTANAVQTSAMTTGTKTIAHGDLIAIGMAMTTAAGADGVVVNLNTNANMLSANCGVPCITSNTSGSYVRTSNALPNAYIVFDDGTVGWIFGINFTNSVSTSITINSGTATADEYGNLINMPHTYVALGISATISIAGTSSDYEMLLYTTPLGTPAVAKTITIDATQIAGTGVGLRVHALFSSPYNILPNTDYAVTIRPTTTNNLSLYYSDTNTVAGGGKTGYPNGSCYAVRRLDNTGAFSDYNGGTAKTRLMYASLIGAHMEQGINRGNYHIGI